ncbi:hypothetical protein R6Q59_029578 [Mikania micrantha]
MENVVISTALKPQVFVESSKANDFVALYKLAFGAEEVNSISHPMRKANRELLLLLSMVILLRDLKVLQDLKLKNLLRVSLSISLLIGGKKDRGKRRIILGLS